MNSNHNSKSQLERSDPGAVGQQIRGPLGLDDNEPLDEV